MEVEIHHTIRDTDEKEWESLVGTEYIERSHAWYKTVEDSEMVTMHYVLIRENNTLAAAACCFPYAEKMYIKMPLLEVKTPLGTSYAFFYRKPQHIPFLVQGLKEIQEKENLKGILILEIKKENLEHLKNEMEKFIYFPIREDTYFDISFARFDEYLRSLKKDSVRRSVRNTLNKAKKWGIEVVATTEFSQWKSVARRLQGYTCRQYQDERIYLTEKFYEACEKNLKEQAELLLLLKDDIPLVSVLCFNSSTISLCKYVGIDPEYKQYQAYFLLYYEIIKRGIERGQKRIYFGPSTYGYKEKIGCRREDLFGFSQLENPVMNIALKCYVKGLDVLGKKF